MPFGKTSGQEPGCAYDQWNLSSVSNAFRQNVRSGHELKEVGEELATQSPMPFGKTSGQDIVTMLAPLPNGTSPMPFGKTSGQDRRKRFGKRLLTLRLQCLSAKRPVRTRA